MLRIVFAVLFAAFLATAVAAQTAPAAPPVPAGMVDLGAPPLNPVEMNEVMAWIASKTSALRLPFCWKQTYGNGAGEPYSCAPGFERNGLLCYPTCKAGFAGNGPVCWETCPAGFRNDPFDCGKPAAYGRGAGYVAWQGDQCKKDHPEGCEEDGLLWYPKCKAGFHTVGLNICSPDCPAGMDDIGVSCQKQSYGRGAGQTLAMGQCRPGLQKDPSGALCYPTCKAGFNMVGPVCWQACTSALPWDCGAACSTDQAQCAKAVPNMVVSPIMLAVSLIPYVGEVKGAVQGAMGAAKVAETVADAAKEADALAGAAKGVEGVANIAKGAEATAQLKAAYQAVKDAVAAVKGKVADAVGGEDNLAKLMDQAKVAGRVYVADKYATKQIVLFSKEFADNFAALTSPAIAAQIDDSFSPEAAYQIEREWGVRHLFLMLNADGTASVQNDIGLASAVDPTGVLSVVSAYDHPICATNVPFPAVHPININSPAPTLATSAGGAAVAAPASSPTHVVSVAAPRPSLPLAKAPAVAAPAPSPTLAVAVTPPRPSVSRPKAPPAWAHAPNPIKVVSVTPPRPCLCHPIRKPVWVHATTPGGASVIARAPPSIKILSATALRPPMLHPRRPAVWAHAAPHRHPAWRPVAQSWLCHGHP